MTELSLLEYINALNLLSEIIREKMVQIENDPPGYQHRVAVRDAIAEFGNFINADICVDLIPRDYRPPQPIRRFIYILPPSISPSSSSSYPSSSSREDQSEFHTFVIRRIAEPGASVKCTLLQLFEFMHSLPRQLSQSESLPGGRGGTAEIPDTCSICLESYHPEPEPIVSENTAATGAHHSTDSQPEELPAIVSGNIAATGAHHPTDSEPEELPVIVSENTAATGAHHHTESGPEGLPVIVSENTAATGAHHSTDSEPEGLPATLSENTAAAGAHNSKDSKPAEESPAMVELEVPVRLPCGHIFGEACVQKWILREESGDPPTCPLCRRRWIIKRQGKIRQVVVSL